jgi:hypothetical protein
MIRQQVWMENFDQIRQHPVRIGRRAFEEVVAAKFVGAQVVVVQRAILEGGKIGKPLIRGFQVGQGGDKTLV